MKKQIVTGIAGLGLGIFATLSLTTPSLFLDWDANAAGADTYRQLNLFGDVFERIKADYVEEPTDQDLVRSAINGMLVSLDPHSGYLPPKEFGDMQEQTRGAFGGLGIEVTMEDGYVKVVSPIDDTPAMKAGVIGGDLIVELDGQSVKGLTLEEAVERMRGEVNEPIELMIVREGADKPINLTIIRDVIRIQSVKFRKEGEDIGYLRVTSFTEQSYDGIRRGLRELSDEMGDSLTGFVVDLRNNPGGLLDQAIAVSDAFLDRGEIVSTRGRHEDETQRFNARSGDLASGLPVIVLINGGSASASEIVAGALQDHARATILGSRSFGKGSVQSIIPLGENGAIRLTTARYYTPSGTSIQATGIEPDVKITQPLPDELKGISVERGESQLRGHLNAEDGEEQSGSSAYMPREGEEDLQLGLALKLLRGEETHESFPPNPDKLAQKLTE
jgi:carboxyl-terminal processing protease